MRRSGVRLPMAPPSQSTQIRKALCRRIPQIHVLRFERVEFERFPNDFTRRCERREFTRCNGLDANISQCGGFGWPRDRGNARGVGSELVEQPVLAAAANDVQLLDAVTGESLKFEQCLALLQGQAFEGT